MIYLQSVSLKEPVTDHRFPFNLPLIQNLQPLTLHSPVTLFVGENGTGKSTLLEGMAAAASLPTVGTEEMASDSSLQEAMNLGRRLRLSWKKRTLRGFFLRAEDLLGYARRLVRMKLELEQEVAELREQLEQQGASEYAKALALGALYGQLAALKRRYGEGLDHRSHGESFLFLLQERVVPEGLYLLDEPETPLSPQNQLTLLCLLHEMVAQGSQFVVATHSPILLAYPGAEIISLDHSPPRVVDYQHLAHVTLTRSFLNNPESFFSRMFQSKG